jgi:hypothetical protein
MPICTQPATSSVGFVIDVVAIVKLVVGVVSVVEVIISVEGVVPSRQHRFE